MLEMIISGGQTGADQAALRAARAAGIPTGGTAPKLWLSEDAPSPWLADFGLVEHDLPRTEPPADHYGPEWKRWVSTIWGPRTRQNVIEADATLWCGDWMTPGGKATLDACRLNGKPFLIVYQGITRPSEVAKWIQEKGVRVLNVAGNRESRSPGIGDRVERFLSGVFEHLRRNGWLA